MNYLIISLAICAGIQLAVSVNYPINPDTGLKYDPATGINFDPYNGDPITNKAQVRALYPTIADAQIPFYFRNFPPAPTTVNPLDAFPRNINTGLPQDPKTGIQYNPATGEAIKTVPQIRALYKTVTYDQIVAYFPNVSPPVTFAALTTANPVNKFPKNQNTGLPEDPKTGLQYNPATGEAITTIPQVRAIFPSIIYNQIPYYFPNIPVTAAPTTVNPISRLPKSANTGLPEDPKTMIQYNPSSFVAITTVSQVKQIFPTITDQEMKAYFPNIGAPGTV